MQRTGKGERSKVLIKAPQGQSGCEIQIYGGGMFLPEPIFCLPSLFSGGLRCVTTSRRPVSLALFRTNVYRGSGDIMNSRRKEYAMIVHDFLVKEIAIPCPCIPVVLSSHISYCSAF